MIVSVCPNIHLCIHLFVHLSICPSTYLSIHPRIYLPTHPFIHLFMNPLTCKSAHSSIHQIIPSIHTATLHISVHKSMLHPIIYLSIHTVLANFMSAWHKQKPFGNQEPLLRKHPYQTGQWTSMWGILLTGNWCGRVKPIVGGDSPGQVVLGCIRKPNEQAS